MNTITFTNDPTPPTHYSVGDMFMIDGELSILAEFEDYYQLISLKDGVAWPESYIEITDYTNGNVIPLDYKDTLNEHYDVEYLGTCELAVTLKNTRN